MVFSIFFCLYITLVGFAVIRVISAVFLPLGLHRNALKTSFREAYDFFLR